MGKDIIGTWEVTTKDRHHSFQGKITIIYGDLTATCEKCSEYYPLGGWRMVARTDSCDDAFKLSVLNSSGGTILLDLYI